MDEATDKFAELTRRRHQLFGAAARAWEQAARSVADAAGRPERRLPDLEASIDAAFDFAAQMLADQRDFARTLMSLSVQPVASTADRPAPEAEPQPPTGPDGRAAGDTGSPAG